MEHKHTVEVDPKLRELAPPPSRAVEHLAEMADYGYRTAQAVERILDDIASGIKAHLAQLADCAAATVEALDRIAAELETWRAEREAEAERQELLAWQAKKYR